ncbi:hypothetical protein EV702DRAFT_1202756 [Suillus placidus]|uniref:Uncharacterized protein n=1 Tax=Suillus placidus TaxID=48579 RepID=A0A9P7CXP5_9AGAM|nr:hypothetical protein EV702DRAFT_1202756 [Suillus placidus]
MSNPASTAQMVFGLADMANIFEFAASRLLAIRMTLDKSNLVTSSKVRYILIRYLMWEGDGISPPLSRNLRFFVGMLGMSQMELLNYQEFYDAFMKLPASPSSAWVTGRIVRTYPMAWWNEVIDTTNLPNFPEGRLLVTPATLVDPRSMLVAQQLTNIHTGMRQEGEHIVSLLENKIVEAQLVSSLPQAHSALSTSESLLQFVMLSTIPAPHTLMCATFPHCAHNKRRIPALAHRMLFSHFRRPMV